MRQALHPWPPAADVLLAGGKPVIGRYIGRILDALFRKLVPDGRNAAEGL